MASGGVLQVVGQVAGVGGIALGILLIIFRDVIRKNIFPRLGQHQAYRLITLIVTLTFVIAGLGLGAFVFLQTRDATTDRAVRRPDADPDPVIQHHLFLIDQGRYKEAYGELAAAFRQQIPLSVFIELSDTQRAPLGKVVKRTRYHFYTPEQLPGMPRAAFAAAVYRSEFEDGKRFVEQVIVMGEETIWKVAGHTITPCTPPTCN